VGCDLGGRLLTYVVPPLPKKMASTLILVATIILFSLVNLVLLYVYGEGIIPTSDIGAQVGVGLFSAISGFLQTISYPSAHQISEENKTQIATLMNFSTQIGSYFGLGLSVALQFSMPR